MKKLVLIFSLLFLFCLETINAQSTITGIVTDAGKQPIPRVNIVVKETKKGVTADFDGKYSIVV